MVVSSYTLRKDSRDAACILTDLCLPAGVCHRIMNIPTTSSVPAEFNFMLSISCSDGMTTASLVGEGRERSGFCVILDAS